MVSTSGGNHGYEEKGRGQWILGQTGLQIMVLIPEWPEAQDITYTPYHLDTSQ